MGQFQTWYLWLDNWMKVTGKIKLDTVDYLLTTTYGSILIFINSLLYIYKLWLCYTIIALLLWGFLAWLTEKLSITNASLLGGVHWLPNIVPLRSLVYLSTTVVWERHWRFRYYISTGFYFGWSEIIIGCQRYYSRWFRREDWVVVQFSKIESSLRQF